MRACHREPAKRFPSAYEQVEALAEALGFPHAAASADSGAPRLAEPSVPDAPTLRWSKAGSEGTEGEPGTTTGARGSLSAPSSSQAPLRRRVVIAVILVVFLLSGTTVWLRRTPAPPPATDGSARDAGDAAVSE